MNQGLESRRTGTRTLLEPIFKYFRNQNINFWFYKRNFFMFTALSFWFIYLFFLSYVCIIHELIKFDITIFNFKNGNWIFCFFFKNQRRKYQEDSVLDDQNYSQSCCHVCAESLIYDAYYWRKIIFFRKVDNIPNCKSSPATP